MKIIGPWLSAYIFGLPGDGSVDLDNSKHYYKLYFLHCNTLQIHSNLNIPKLLKSLVWQSMSPSSNNMLDSNSCQYAFCHAVGIGIGL